MNIPELSQIVFPPNTAMDDPLIKRVEEILDAEPDEPTRASIKLELGRFLHPLGIHSWVRWRQYDAGSDRIIDLKGQVCAWCPKGRV